MSGLELLVGLAIAIGLIGVVVPLLPGALLVAAAILAWAVDRSDTTGWTVLAIAVAAIALAEVLRFTIPGRRLEASGVPRRSIVLGGLLGVVGFFVIPLIGLLIGFVLGIYLAERTRLGDGAGAWTSTKAALRATGLSILIELAGCLLAAEVWAVVAVGVV